MPELARELERFTLIARFGGLLLVLSGALYFWLEMPLRVFGPVQVAGVMALVVALFGYLWARRRALTIAFGGTSLPSALPFKPQDGEPHA